MAEKLKPCPFCGGRARYVDLGDPGLGLGDPGQFSDWDVECTKCGIVMICPGKEEGCTTTKREAKAAWNRRAEPWN